MSLETLGCKARNEVNKGEVWEEVQYDMCFLKGQGMKSYKEFEDRWINR